MSSTNEHELKVQNTPDRTETGQTNFCPVSGKQRSLSKTHQDYWISRVKKRHYRGRNRRKIQVPEWQVRLFQGNREQWFNLGTANKTAAAIKARDIWVCLEANGWDATIAKFKPASSAEPKANVSVGDYLGAVENLGLIEPRTFLNYRTCFRTIVSEVFGVKADKSRFDYKQGGNERWVARIDSIKLARVTPGRIEKWKHARVKAAGSSPVAVSTAKRTANSTMRCARSLFSADVLEKCNDLELPSPLPFEGVKLFEEGSTKYISKINAEALIAAAKSELKSAEPEAYKVFLLGLFAGMRRTEIDLLEWRMIDWAKNRITLEETEWLHLKTTDSAGTIDVDPEVLQELRDTMPASKGRFVVVSDLPPRSDSVRIYYRCEKVFDRLNVWLRSKGVTARKPLHELRKEIGALVATKHGIYAASRFLRHSDITTTARHYADQKARITVGLGKFLDTAVKPAAEPGKEAA